MATSPSAGVDAAAAALHPSHPGHADRLSQGAEFFLSNYRMGKTLGIGSFGKVRREVPSLPLHFKGPSE